MCARPFFAAKTTARSHGKQCAHNTPVRSKLAFYSDRYIHTIARSLQIGLSVCFLLTIIVCLFRPTRRAKGSRDRQLRSKLCLLGVETARVGRRQSRDRLAIYLFRKNLHFYLYLLRYLYLKGHCYPPKKTHTGE